MAEPELVSPETLAQWEADFDRYLQSGPLFSALTRRERKRIIAKNRAKLVKAILEYEAAKREGADGTDPFSNRSASK